MRRSLLRAAGIAAVACSLACSAAIPAGASVPSPRGWRLVFSKQYLAPVNPFSAVTAAVALSANDAWAFAVNQGGDGAFGHPIALHWHDGRWRQTLLPAGLAGEVNAVSAPAGNDVWAVGLNGGYLIHWNGHDWTVARTWRTGPRSGVQLTGVTAFSPSDVWVFGGGGSDPGLGTWHLSGKKWTLDRYAHVDMACAVSSHDIWGIADTAASPWDIIVRYNGTRWQPVHASLLSSISPRGILALSRNDVWVSGLSAKNNVSPELLHWNGAKWSSDSALLPKHSTYPDDITPDNGGGIWLIARSSSGSWIVHITRHGQVSRTAVTAFLSSVVQPRGTSSAWAMGSYATKTGSAAAIWLHGKRP
jgi:hypothetical protein